MSKTDQEKARNNRKRKLITKLLQLVNGLFNEFSKFKNDRDLFEKWSFPEIELYYNSLQSHSQITEWLQENRATNYGADKIMEFKDDASPEAIEHIDIPVRTKSAKVLATTYKGNVERMQWIIKQNSRKGPKS